MHAKPYNRAGAVRYARTWCMGHNPAYINLDNDNNPDSFDCANFISQCLYEGGDMPMKHGGMLKAWYYLTPGKGYTNKSVSWAGAEGLRLFLLLNTDEFPRLERTFLSDGESARLSAGDLVFWLNKNASDRLSRTARHVAMVGQARGGDIFVYAHSRPRNNERWPYPLTDTLLVKLGDILYIP